MSIWGLIAGVFAQCTLAGIQGMLGIFAIASIVDRRTLNAVEQAVLPHCFWLLPAVPLAVAGLLVVAWFVRPGLLSYWWHALPLLTSGLFLVYAMVKMD
ncbi:hypothetical protein [Luteimonas abyssi]|uniref:hypothetical protein n=1 Tax=Luteimonas abyssi TaxID=1247514 RepID=UPI000737BE62|nr:hypothetical protein [Luteimonas abyssi]